jgi:hypothetical protein
VTDRLKEAERIADVWSARVEQLRAEIAAKGASHVRTAALARAEEGAGKAAERVAAARKHAAKLARLQPLRDSLSALATSIAESVPKVAKRWKDERAKEPKKVKALTKALAKRVSRDKGVVDNPLRPRRPRRQDPVGLPEASTWPTGPIVPVTNPEPLEPEPPREGLLRGEYVEAGRAGRIIGQLLNTIGGKRLPKAWTAQHVGDRMQEAFRVLRRLPMTIWPKQYGACWPEILHDQADGVGQALSGTLQDRNRGIRGTSEDEVSRMHEALGWPMDHLGQDPELARAVNEWAFWSDDEDAEALDAFVEGGLQAIADGLNRKNVVVR